MPFFRMCKRETRGKLVNGPYKHVGAFSERFSDMGQNILQLILKQFYVYTVQRFSWRGLSGTV